MTLFSKTSLLDPDLQAKNDYLHFWQIWHHNWDDADIALIREICPVDDKEVLEIGCGDGRISFELADQTRRFVGIDLHPTLLGCAKSKMNSSAHSKPDSSSHSKLEFFEMDACALDFSGGIFDVVLLPWVLQMVSQPAKAVSEARRVLKFGGKALVIGLTSDSDYDRIIARFVTPVPPAIDTQGCYAGPLSDQFDSVQSLGSRDFAYFFRDLHTAVVAFEFALKNWYSTPVNDEIKEQLRAILLGFQTDAGSVKLNFDAQIYLAEK